MALGRTAVTYRDDEALPDDGRRSQIHDRALEVRPALGPDHHDVLANLLPDSSWLRGSEP